MIERQDVNRVNRISRRAVAEAEQRPMTRVLQDTATHIENVVRCEVQLTIAKAKEEVTAVARASALRVAAVVVGLIGYILLMMALTSFLEPRIGRWQSVLAAAMLNLVMAAVLAFYPVHKPSDT